MSYLDRINDCAQFHPERYLPFRIDGQHVGLITHEFIEQLSRFPDVFTISNGSVDLAEGLKSFAQRTQAVAKVTAQLHADGQLSGWRDEPYPVSPDFSQAALLDIERAAVPLFGTRGYGVHLNGFVRVGREIKMWVGKRSINKQTAPGKLDQLVAGGQPSGKGLRDNLIKECAEEASIPAELATRASSVGTLSYRTERPEGYREDIIFAYDLELPASFTPKNTDGEVEDFYLWSIQRVMDTIRRTDQFKFNAALVIIDFLVRHGLIDADDPDYTQIVAGLRL